MHLLNLIKSQYITLFSLYVVEPLNLFSFEISKCILSFNKIISIYFTILYITHFIFVYLNPLFHFFINFFIYIYIYMIIFIKLFSKINCAGGLKKVKYPTKNFSGETYRDSNKSFEISFT